MYGKLPFSPPGVKRVIMNFVKIGRLLKINFLQISKLQERRKV